MTRFWPARALPVLAVVLRVAVGTVFAVCGAWEWERWESVPGDAMTAVWHWSSGCLRLTFGVWLATGVLMRFAGAFLCVHVGVSVLVGADGPWTCSAALLVLGVSALLVRGCGARWSADHLYRPRRGW